MQDRTRENAHRLAGVLERCTADHHTTERLALLLNYIPEQLVEDARSLVQHLERLEAGEE